MLVSSDVFVRTGIFTGQDRQKIYLKTYLILDFDASEKYNIIHKAIVFFFYIFVKFLEKRKFI